MSKTIQLTAPATFAMKAVEGSEEKIPTLQSNSYNGGKVFVAAHDLPVVVDLAGMEIPESHAILSEHDQTKILGHGSSHIENHQLYTDASITNLGEHVDQAVRLGKSGFPWQASIGAQPTKLERVGKDKTVEANGQTFTGPLLIARKSKLREVSLVVFGADDSTSTSIAASATHKENKNMSPELQAHIEKLGFTPEELSAEQASALEASMSSTADTVQLSTAESVIEAAKSKAALHGRYATIVASAIDGGLATDVAEKLVEAAKAENLSAERFELEVLRASRHAPAATRGKAANVNSNVIECAIAREAGDADIEDNYTPEVLEAADRSFKNGLSLVQLMQMQASANGYGNISHRDPKALLQAAFAPVQASSSTHSLSGILSNVANKMLKRGFESVDQSWREVSAISSVSDFKEMTSYSLDGDFKYQKVAPGGELSHATAGERNYTNQADTYGRMFALDRRDILNDDLSAFQVLRSRMGRGAALKFNEVFWTEFLSNLSMFVASENRLSGAGSALGVDALSSALVMFEDQKDYDGHPLGMSPSILLTANANKVLAKQLMSDLQVRVDGTGSGKKSTTGNPHAGAFKPVSSTYLNQTAIPNGSATHWWLMADPQDLALIETVFLFGRQAPVIESADADFNTLGIQMRGYHDFGVKLQEPKAAVYNVGA